MSSNEFPLFVYGSLLRDFPHPMSAYLWEQSTFVGEALLPGRLYHLGAYPGFVPDRETTDRVYGQLALLDPHKAAMVWRELDIYEGTNLPDPEYDRILFEPPYPVQGYTQIWLYRYRLSLDRAQWIESGDFRTVS